MTIQFGNCGAVLIRRNAAEWLSETRLAELLPKFLGPKT